MKYSKKITQKIYNLLRSDSYTISEICENVGISRSLFYDWKAKYPEFCESIKKAQKEFKELSQVEARKSLVKLVKGYTVQEKKTVTVDTGKKDEDGKPIVRVKEHIVTEKYFPPNLKATIFTLINLDPDNWKNKHNTEMGGTVNINQFEQMSDKELEDFLKSNGIDPEIIINDSSKIE